MSDFEDLQGRLLFALPKKGRLHEACLQLLQGADIQFHRRNRLDIALSTNLPVALVFLPAHDVANFVGRGKIALGITGQDMVAEAGVAVRELLPLGFGKCRLAVQCPIASEVTDPRALVGKRIATSFESVVSRYFAQLEAGIPHDVACNSVANAPKDSNNARPARKDIPQSLETSINYVSGSVEAACALGLADAVVDLVESGETMREAKLHDIATIISSQAVLIANNSASKDHAEMINLITRRIEGVVAANKYVLCGYNVQRHQLKEAIRITPGKKAPTISPLEDSDWVAVSSMVLKNEIASKMDELTAVGAIDIIVTRIDNCRVSV